MADSESTPTQRSFGRGMFEGLRLAGVENPGEFMNNAKMRAIEQSLSGIAKKIYDLIPVEKPIGIPEICRLLSDRGSRCDPNVAKGCLGDLIDRGLVRGSGGRSMELFQRVAPKPVVVSSNDNTVDDDEDKPVQQPTRNANASPLEKLADLECRMKALCSQHMKLVDEIGTVAIDVEQFIARIKDDNSKVAQLKALLKDL